jgi:transposase-like protein
MRIGRPNKDDLMEDVKIIGYSATGRKYGVSDNTIRKWLK